ncbi:uncharacterized protein DFL_004679 [Arthrobotrys flagrans]|uniref:Uncharacterized protein n=1 Tax=Arthrobotrys flagrans TaxID=97331 RepID=A0A437A574_ARTFL|nr:hypothetical protein DFL_004679 [Arthrobotrys flagrans]
MADSLKDQTIYVRYIPSQQWLEDQLRNIFPPGSNFQVNESQVDDSDRWVLKVPKELSEPQIRDLQRKARKENTV